ncbi:hypothetical protein [Cytobacillus purgationiresistens]|uniref:hypothetical protein n=1 Tax=Cytobacillus purgationiresistens TaxID=863449 RepID=UPI0027D859A4|nr:hypothetical protein [Cytobacillus purgationiresistens]
MVIRMKFYDTIFIGNKFVRWFIVNINEEEYLIFINEIGRLLDEYKESTNNESKTIIIEEIELLGEVINK